MVISNNFIKVNNAGRFWIDLRECGLKNRIFDQNPNFWTNNRFFDQKPILDQKNRIFDQNPNF